MARNPRDQRHGWAYWQLCASVRALGLPCYWCGEPIRYDITGREASRHRDAFTLEHITPLSRGGAALDPANCTAAHRRCNSARGNRVAPPRKDTSRRWYRRG